MNWRVALCCLLLSGCADECRNQAVQTAEDPGGRAKAILFSRDCGATTSFSSQVSVLVDDRPLAGGGNVFVADGDHGAAAAAAWGGPWAEVRWLSPAHLLVRYDEKARVFIQEHRRSGIEITYAPVRMPPQK